MIDEIKLKLLKYYIYKLRLCSPQKQDFKVGKPPPSSIFKTYNSLYTPNPTFAFRFHSFEPPLVGGEPEAGEWMTEDAGDTRGGRVGEEYVLSRTCCSSLRSGISSLGTTNVARLFKSL